MLRTWKHERGPGHTGQPTRETTETLKYGASGNFLGGMNAVQRRTPGAVRCTSPSWTSEVLMPELAACQSAQVQPMLARQAWARRLRRLAPPPWSSPKGLWERALVRSVSRTSRLAQTTPPSCPNLVLVAGMTARDAHSVDDCRRHALFITMSSNEPSTTERARVVLACAWMQFLKLRKMATSQGCKYEALCVGMKHSGT